MMKSQTNVSLKSAELKIRQEGKKSIRRKKYLRSHVKKLPRNQSARKGSREKRAYLGEKNHLKKIDVYNSQGVCPKGKNIQKKQRLGVHRGERRIGSDNLPR